jgi:hypothetical protein
MKTINDYIVVENFLSKDTCNTIIENIDKKTYWEKHNWYNPKENYRYSKSDKELDVLCIDYELSKIIYPIVNKAIKNYVKRFDIGGENTTNFINYFTPVRFNKYITGTKMRKHFDFIQSIFDGNYKGIPILSIVGSLNDNYEGGEFVFNDNHIIKLNAGDFLMFPSTFMYAHEVREITKGTRYSFVSWGF